MLGASAEVNGPIGRVGQGKLIRSTVEPARRWPLAPAATYAEQAAIGAAGARKVVSRVAIIGSCITRDLWPIQGEAPKDLLYISRTSLPSLFSPAVGGIEPFSAPPAGLRPRQHEAVVTDLKKRALGRLIAHQPTHIIFDFIDERFDLLAAEDAWATHSWELEVAGYLARGDLRRARPVPRLSEACERIWTGAVAEMAAFLAGTPLRQATVILHSAQWADSYRTARGRIRPMEDETMIWEGRPARRSAHNALLSRYQDQFLAAFPGARIVSAADHRVADETHRWGLSPFHYVPAYYRTILDQLGALGI